MREFFVKDHSELTGLYCISEPSNKDFDLLFIHGKVRMSNIFNSWNSAIEWLQRNIPGDKKVIIETIILEQKSIPTLKDLF